MSGAWFRHFLVTGVSGLAGPRALGDPAFRSDRWLAVHPLERSPRCFLTLLVLAACSWPAGGGAAAPVSARVERLPTSERAVAVGALIEQTLVATVPRVYALDTGRLPPVGAVEEWLELRAVDWTKQDLGSERRYQIRFVYQIFRGAREEEVVRLPTPRLHFRGPEDFELEAPESELTLIPRIPAALPDEAVAIRAESAPRPRTTVAHWRRLWWSLSAALAATAGLLWLALDARLRGQPFGHACCRFGRLRRTPGAGVAYLQGARLIHQALDETVGKTLFAFEVDAFCRERPAFAALREDLRQFFGRSRVAFFDPSSSLPPDDGTIEGLAELCRRCAAAERAGR